MLKIIAALAARGGAAMVAAVAQGVMSFDPSDSSLTGGAPTPLPGARAGIVIHDGAFHNFDWPGMALHAWAPHFSSLPQPRPRV